MAVIRGRSLPPSEPSACPQRHHPAAVTEERDAVRARDTTAALEMIAQTHIPDDVLVARSVKYSLRSLILLPVEYFPARTSEISIGSARAGSGGDGEG